MIVGIIADTQCCTVVSVRKQQRPGVHEGRALASEANKHASLPQVKNQHLTALNKRRHTLDPRVSQNVDKQPLDVHELKACS